MDISGAVGFTNPKKTGYGIIFLLSCDHMGLVNCDFNVLTQSNWACDVVKQCSCCHVIKCLQHPGLDNSLWVGVQLLDKQTQV